MVGYVNGVQQFSFADSSGYGIISGANALRFFKDDTASGDLLDDLFSSKPAAPPDEYCRQQAQQEHRRPLRGQEVVADGANHAEEKTAQHGPERTADTAHQRGREGDQAALGAVRAERARVVEREHKGSGAREGTAQSKGPADGSVPVDTNHLRKLLILCDRSDSAAQPCAQQDVRGHYDEQDGGNPHKHIGCLQNDAAR